MCFKLTHRDRTNLWDSGRQNRTSLKSYRFTLILLINKHLPKKKVQSRLLLGIKINLSVNLKRRGILIWAWRNRNHQTNRWKVYHLRIKNSLQIMKTSTFASQVNKKIKRLMIIRTSQLMMINPKKERISNCNNN